MGVWRGGPLFACLTSVMMIAEWVGQIAAPPAIPHLTSTEGMWVQFLVYKGRSHGPNWALVVGLTSVFSPILHSGAFLMGPERMLPGQVPRRPQHSRPEQPSKWDLQQSSTSFPRHCPDGGVGEGSNGTKGPEWAGGRGVGEWRGPHRPCSHESGRGQGNGSQSRSNDQSRSRHVSNLPHHHPQCVLWVDEGTERTRI